MNSNNETKNDYSYDKLPEIAKNHDQQIMELRREIEELREIRNFSKKMFSPSDVENEFGIPKATVYLLKYQGKLSGIKKGKRLYFTYADILSYLESGRFEKTA